MKKTIIQLTLIATIALSLTGCRNARTDETNTPAAEPQATASGQVSAEDNGQAIPAGHDGAAEAEVVIGRQDGERFEDVIILEGMEETVRYEHVRNNTVGIEMDYDYESFLRSSRSDRERFVSIWDDRGNPENYLEVTYSPKDADTVAASVTEILSNDYDLIREAYTLDSAGSCIRIEASELRGTGRMADQLQIVYIIPAADGCRVATEHFSIESAEGFGRRFSYMMKTLMVTDRAGERTLTDEQALSAIRNYCCINNPDLQGIVNDGDYPAYWEIASSTDSQVAVLFRSYTGAQIRYYIDRLSGDTYVTEFVPGITPEEEPSNESLNAWDYLY